MFGFVCSAASWVNDNVIQSAWHWTDDDIIQPVEHGLSAGYKDQSNLVLRWDD